MRRDDREPKSPGPNHRPPHHRRRLPQPTATTPLGVQLRQPASLLHVQALDLHWRQSSWRLKFLQLEMTTNQFRGLGLAHRHQLEPSWRRSQSTLLEPHATRLSQHQQRRRAPCVGQTD